MNGITVGASVNELDASVRSSLGTHVFLLHFNARINLKIHACVFKCIHLAHLWVLGSVFGEMPLPTLVCLCLKNQ